MMTSRRSLQTFNQRLSRQTQFVPGHVGGRVASAQPVKRRPTIGASTARPPVPPDEVWYQYQSYHTDGSGLDAELGSLAGVSAAFAVVSTAGQYLTQIPSGWTELHRETLTQNGKGEWLIMAIDNVVGNEGTTVTSVDDPTVGYAGGQVSWCYVYGGDGTGGWQYSYLRDDLNPIVDLAAPGVSSGPYYQCFWCQGVWGFTSYPAGMTLIGPGVLAGGFYPPRLDPFLPLRYETEALPEPIVGGQVVINGQYVSPVWGSVAAWWA